MYNNIIVNHGKIIYFHIVTCYKQADVDVNTKMSTKSWRLVLETHVAKKLHPVTTKSLGTIWSRHKKCCRNHMFEIHWIATIQRRKMKEENSVMRENARMKNNKQNLWMKKKKQWKLQDEDQWNFRTKMKWCMVG